MAEPGEAARALSHVLWIAGSPCAGKSSIGHTLARVHVFIDYHADAFERHHFARWVAAGDAEAQAILRMSDDERWLCRPVEEMLRETISIWTRKFPLVIEDLMALPRENLIVAEGNFFPASVAPYLSSHHQAIWLVPTDAFVARVRTERHRELAERQRRLGIPSASSDPEHRLRNIIARDCQLARYVKEQVEALGLPVIEVDGSRSLEEMTEAVERHIEPYLMEFLTRPDVQG